MNVADWLARRTPAPPPALRDRIASALNVAATDDGACPSTLCLETAERILRELAARDDRARDAALELLAADALVTYAFEAAAETPESLDGRTGDAMARLARLDRA